MVNVLQGGRRGGGGLGEQNLLRVIDDLPSHETEREFVCLLVAYRPSNMRVYLGDGSAQTILRAATLR